MKSLPYLSSLIFATAICQADAATIIYFDGTSFSEDAAVGGAADSANVTAGNFALTGAGTVPNDLVVNQTNAGLSNLFNGQAVAPAARFADVDLGDEPVISFTITVDPGFQFNLTDLTGLGMRVSNNGANGWGFSLDGTPIGSTVSLTPGNGAETDVWFEFGASGLTETLTGTSTVSIVYSNVVGSNQQIGFDEIVLEGTVTAVPEPGQVALLGLGGLLLGLRRRR